MSATSTDLTVGFIGAGMMASAIMVRHEFSFGFQRQVTMNCPLLTFILTSQSLL